LYQGAPASQIKALCGLSSRVLLCVSSPQICPEFRPIGTGRGYICARLFLSLPQETQIQLNQAKPTTWRSFQLFWRSVVTTIHVSASQAEPFACYSSEYPSALHVVLDFTRDVPRWGRQQWVEENDTPNITIYLLNQEILGSIYTLSG